MMANTQEHHPRFGALYWEYRFIVLDSVDEVPGQLNRDDRDGWEAVNVREYPDDGPVRVLQRRSLTVQCGRGRSRAAVSHGSR